MKRCEAVTVQICDIPCPGQHDEVLKFNLFEEDEKLRSGLL